MSRRPVTWMLAVAPCVACTLLVDLDGLDDGSSKVADASDATSFDAADAADATILDDPNGPPSCRGLTLSCGANKTTSCCDAPELPAGTYNRVNSGSFPATVSKFRLDRFEVTVGRFRAFVATRSANDRENFERNLSCGDVASWTVTPGDREFHPISCTLQEEAVEFCVWDGGHLVTEAQWNYAAAGGGEQRYFPWADKTYDPSRAVYGAGVPLAAVGSKPKGAGRWGHFDLTGNVIEIMADGDGPLSVPCNDCVQDASPSGRIMHRGGGFRDEGDGGIYLSTVFRDGEPNRRDPGQGFRCAR